jgi:cytochrome c oxidase subunit 2
MKKMQSLLSLSASSMLLLSACQPGALTEGTSSSSSEAMMETSSAPYLDGMGSSSSEEPVVIDLSSAAGSAGDAMPSSQQAAAPRVITINVTTWSFSPSTINVRKGEKIQLKLVGGDGIHSFTSPGLGLNVRVEPGKTVVVDLTTDTAGVFEAHCAIPCGAGHKDMKATIVVS